MTPLRTYISTILCCAAAMAYADVAADSIVLDNVVVTTKTGVRKMRGATNTQVISASELKRAACCNLGESFSTNPSVDVNYSDAATGARQIRLLGLSGQYVQMLTENIPNFRGAAAPYGLGYIAGPWMQSIQVSKGASSVKNGYESITGQINVEMKKPQLDPSVSVNAYADMMGKVELNADGNFHMGKSWSAALLAHGENAFAGHDSDGDGFLDLPRIRQIALMPRVAYLGRNYVFQAAVKYLDENRRSGQLTHHAPANPYIINIDTRRAEAFTKNAYIFDHDNDGNIALILSGSFHRQDAAYGVRYNDIDQREGYASLMFERKWLDRHALSAGLSAVYDRYDFRYLATGAPEHMLQSEFTPGAYAQYTFNIGEKFVAMGGVRYDHSSRYGGMVTPRAHVRYNPLADLTFHASAGRGWRSPHPLAEFSYMLASSRHLDIAANLHAESAWNYGIGAGYTFRPAGKKLAIDAEYYYTTFENQLMLDLDSDAHTARIFSSARHSFSNAVQVELTFDPRRDLSLGLAWRLTDVRADYTGSGLMEKPLTSRHKALLTASYSPRMGLWQADLSLAVNGSGRMPTPYILPDGTLSWPERYKPFTQLNFQLTRNFRHWAVYIGGENLTNFRQKNAIIGASDPWGSTFDATMIYGPLHGAMVYAGFRYNFTKFI